jgi:hypothetical protein
MDDIFGLGRSVEEGIKLFREPLATLLGPAWNEAGGALGDQVRHWRDRRRVELALRVVKKLRSKGIEPRAVEPSILLPILDAGSLATDEGLQQKWASLLAKAASGEAHGVSPAYAEILRQLTPLEAQVLDWVFANGTPQSQGRADSFVVLTLDLLAVEQHFALSHYDAEVLASNFLRLGLIETDSIPPRSYHQFSLTPIGTLFVAACRE